MRTPTEKRSDDTRVVRWCEVAQPRREPEFAMYRATRTGPTPSEYRAKNGRIRGAAGTRPQGAVAGGRIAAPDRNACRALFRRAGDTGLVSSGTPLARTRASSAAPVSPDSRT